MIYLVALSVLIMSIVSLLIDISGKVSFSFSWQGSAKGGWLATIFCSLNGKVN